jgi:hypothetical protein
MLNETARVIVDTGLYSAGTSNSNIFGIHVVLYLHNT